MNPISLPPKKSSFFIERHEWTGFTMTLSVPQATIPLQKFPTAPNLIASLRSLNSFILLCLHYDSNQRALEQLPSGCPWFLASWVKSQPSAGSHQSRFPNEEEGNTRKKQKHIGESWRELIGYTWKTTSTLLKCKTLRRETRIKTYGGTFGWATCILPTELEGRERPLLMWLLPLFGRLWFI